MPHYDLNDPQRTGSGHGPERPPVVATALVSAALLLGLVAAVWVAVVDDPDGGRPVVVATIEDSPQSTGSLASPDVAGAPAAAVPPAVPPAGAEQVAMLPAMPSVTGAEPGMTEQTAFGAIPRTAPDGRRPRDAYARRSPQASAAVPRIAIVLGGMGLSQTGTQRAIERLPEDVTLAFAPYGFSLQRWVQKARGEGHEIVLQIPLEPDDYPQNDPGEHTLLVSTDRQSNQRALHWNLSRMTAYAGVMNYMGARFTAEDKALTPFLGELGERGLYYLDDGSSQGSRAAAVGEALQVPVVTADAIVDADRSAAAIERELTSLEVIARSRGVAVGVGSAFPETVDAVASWIASAQARGIVIVPASAVASR